MGVNHDANWLQLSEFVARVMNEKKIPGVALGILYKGETATAGLGVTNVDHPLPVTDEALFQIGSITKTFTGTAIMRLVEMGKLALDATVRTYASDFKVRDATATSQATIRHLLTHMGGWVGDYFDDTGPGDDALPKYMAGMADLEQLAPFNTVWSYNNSGFRLAGHIIEVVTGQRYQAALKELVLDPLGLNSTYFDPGDVITHRFAVGHNVGDESVQVARPWQLPRSSYSAGGIACHVQDLLRYARFHLGDGGTEDGQRLLSPESMAQMQASRVTIWGSEAWGLSWATDEIDGTHQVSHGGSVVGQVALLALIPEHDFAIAIMTNADRGRGLYREVHRQALKQYLGLEIAIPTPIVSSEKELARYVGRYSRPYAEIELGMLGGKLIGQLIHKGGYPAKDSPPEPSPPPMSLALCEEDRLLVLDGVLKDEKWDIVRKEDGSIGWLRASRRIHVRE